MIHIGDAPYTCDFCSKTFIRPSTLEAHKMIHTGESQYQCYVCRKIFNSSRDLK